LSVRGAAWEGGRKPEKRGKKGRGKEKKINFPSQRLRKIGGKREKIVWEEEREEFRSYPTQNE